MNFWNKSLAFGAASLVSASTLLAGNNLVTNPGFENGTAGWENFDSQSEIVAGEGRNGSHALRITRTQFDAPRALIKGHVKLETGRRYRISGWVRTDGKLEVRGREGSTPIVGLEYWQKGKYGGWVAAYGPSDDSEWKKTEVNYVAGDNDGASFVLLLMLSSVEYTGTIWFDDICIEQIPGDWNFHMVYPMQNTFSIEGGKVRFFSHFLDIPLAEQQLDLVLKSGGKEVWQQRAIVPGGFTFESNLPKLPAGEYTLGVTLKDKSGNVLRECSRTIYCAAPRNPDFGSRIDENGNLIVHGKKFLPVGAYTGDLSHQDVDRLVGAGFNFVITYNTTVLSPNNLPGKDCSLKTIRAALDYCHEKGLKVGLSLTIFDPDRRNTIDGLWEYPDRISAITAIVKELRNHPALVCWYITDEPTPECRPWGEKLSRLLAGLDSDHVTLGCFNTVGTVPVYAGLNDITSFDHYPIKSGAGDISGEVSISRKMNEYQLPYWWIGQIMHWGAFKAEKGLRYPTADEMLAQNLTALINGAKGIVNFSAKYLVLDGDEALREKRLADWRYMQSRTIPLADFILSDLPAPQCAVKNEKGTLLQRTFANGNGELAVLLVAPYEGENQAVVMLPTNTTLVKSECGKVKLLNENSVRFTGKDCSCDILYLRKK